IKSSLAQAEYTVKFDKGEAPRGGVSTYLEHFVEEERPLEIAAFVLSPTEVVIPDPMIHPRFIEAVAVRFGDELVEASPAAYATDQNAMILKLDKPLKGAKPLKFDAGKDGPYLAVTYELRDDAWFISVRNLSAKVALTQAGRQFQFMPSCCLIVDSEGTAVGIAAKKEMPVDDSWKGSPLEWPAMSVAEMAEALEKLDKAVSQDVLHVRLSFRSPKKTSRRDGDGGRTEHNVLGGLIDKNRILVLANLKPKVTARLERIVVRLPDGEPVAAEFTCTLKDYGAFIATLEKPLPGALTISTEKITNYRNKLLLGAEVALRGEKVTTYLCRNRITGFDMGWKRHIYPEACGKDKNLMLFEATGELVALPIIRREKVSLERSWSRKGGELTAAAQLAELLLDLAENSDPGNVPLTEQEENRLAWLGAELQPLNKELARINKVSDLTKDGEIGALVSCVYPDSPAGKADVKVGDVLIRLHVEDHPKPIDVKVEEYGFGSRPFPWEHYDRMPEYYYDRIPCPWPPAENNLTRALTDLGFGRKFTAELFRDGEIIRKDFIVAESLPHYDSAARYKSDDLGLTVRDVTYELRRYFQRTPKDPGVIVSKIEPGSKASVAGIKPYEIVTRVNDKPVMNVKDFEEFIAEGGELRLSIKRMTKGRVVKIKAKLTATTQPAAAITQPAAEKTDELPSSGD
ncbi:MAG: hypothetical protein KAU28_00875, partial [Phycisphaerae bacterium]|nr:hypothetical protein [Phycisphaerae bacterium]